MKTFSNVILILLLLQLLSPVGAVASSSSDSSDKECASLLDEAKAQEFKRKFFLERTIQTAPNSDKLHFSPENIEFLKKQRENFRQTIHFLENNYFETEALYHALIKARMGRVHIWAGGSPGSAKSDLVKLLYSVPQALPDGSHRSDFFEIQLTQASNEIPFIGYVDKKNFGFGTILKPEHVSNAGTAMHYGAVHVEEIEKGGPASFQALLGLMAEGKAAYGPLVLKARTETVVATSNLTDYEFLDLMERDNLRSTAEPLMDRLLYKVLTVNFILDNESRQQLHKNAELQKQASARKNLADQAQRFSTGQALTSQVASDLPVVDLAWLGDLASQGFVLTDDARSVVDTILVEMRKYYTSEQLKSEAEIETSGPQVGAVYHPPNELSTRITKYQAFDSIKRSLLVDLLSLPESVLSTETLVKLLEEQIPVDRLSTWRIQDILLAGLVAQPKPVLVESGKVSTGPAYTLSLEYGEIAEKLRSQASSRRRIRQLNHIIDGRRAFTEIYTNTNAAYQSVSNPVSEIMAKSKFASLLRQLNSSPRPSIEEMLFFLSGDRPITPDELKQRRAAEAASTSVTLQP